MKRLLHVAVVMGSFSAVNLLVGFARSKFGALLLGPAGIGQLAQANLVLHLVVTVGSLTIGAGVVKMVSEAKAAGDRERLDEILNTCLTLLASTGLAAGAVMLALLWPTAEVVLGDVALALPLAGIVVALPFAVLTTGLLADPVLLGLGRYDLYTRGSLQATALGLIPFVGLTYVWGLRGAVASIGIAVMLRFGVFVYHVRQAIDWRPRLGVLSGRTLRTLFAFAGMMMVANVLFEGGNVWIRTLILTSLGPAQNGLYQVPVALSSYYSVLFTNAVWGHFHVRMSQGMSTEDREDTLNTTIRFVILSFCAMAAILLAARGPVVALLYSPLFADAATLIPFFVLGDLLFLVATVYHASLLALPRLRTNLILWVLYSILRVLLSWVLMSRLGLVGPVVAYCLSATAMFVGYWIYHQTRLSMRLRAGNVWLLSSGAAALTVPALLPIQPVVRGVVHLVAISAWLLLALDACERRAIVVTTRMKLRTLFGNGEPAAEARME